MSTLSSGEEIRIEQSDDSVEWEDAAELTAAVGWGRRVPSELQAAFARSSFKAFAFEGPRLVGFGRTVDDGRYYASIVDVIVHPEYQRRGVGKAILSSLQGRLKGFLVVNLTAAEHVQEFYRRYGWKRQRTAMMLPRSEAQAQANCEP